MLIRHRAGVLGSPISHSLSPILHAAAYEALGLHDWSYTAHECDADVLAELLDGLGPTWAGLSLTMPLKEQALVLAAQASAEAEQTGAANTLIRQGRSWQAHNTDVSGIRESLRDAGVGRGGAPAAAVLIGSGATARSALAALAELGVRQVSFVVRDDIRRPTLQQAQQQGFTVERVPDQDAAQIALAAPVLINTTPAHAGDDLAARIAAAGGGADDERVFLDVVYADWPTALGTALADSGATVIPGIEMLVHQAAEQVHLMTGLPAPLDAIQTAGRAALHR